MFKNIIYSLCCTILVYGSSLSMNLDRMADSDVRQTAIISYDFGNKLLNEYANCGFSIWEADGQRFLDQSFLDTYAEKGVAPVLEDGRPNIGLWLGYTRSSNTFFVGWNWETRSEFAKPFLEHMLDVYSKLGVGTDGVPSHIDSIRAILSGIEESFLF